MGGFELPLEPLPVPLAGVTVMWSTTLWWSWEPVPPGSIGRRSG